MKTSTLRARSLIPTIGPCLLAAALSACMTPGGKGAPELAKYQAFLDGLPADNPDSIRAAADAFQERFGDGRQADKDAAFLAFRTFYYATIDPISKRFFACWKSEDAMKAFVAALYRNGLAVWVEICDCFVDESDSHLAATFAPHVSAPIREYLLLRQAELREPYDDDAVLLLSFERLGDRCLNWDLYLERFPHSPLREEAESYYRDYIETLLLGMDNSPVLVDNWPPEAKAGWLADIEAAYSHIIEQYPKTRTGRLLSQYYPLVKASGFSRTPDVDAFVKPHEIDYTQTPPPSGRYCHDCGRILTAEQFWAGWHDENP